MTQIALPPTLRDSSPVANGVALRRDPLGFFTRLAHEAGGFAHYLLNEGPVYFVNNAELVREILVVQDDSFSRWFAGRGLRMTLGSGLLGSDGAAHDAMRQCAQPFFHTSRLHEYARRIVEIAEQEQARWPTQGELDVSTAMARITLESLAQTLFGVSMGERAGEVFAALDTVQQSFEKFGASPADDRRFLAAHENLNALMRELIDERRRSGAVGDDLFAVLLDGRDDDDEQIVEELRNFFLAGYVTTASSLACAWWLLSKHPDEQEALRAQVHDALQGRAPAYGDLAKLTCCEMIFLEVLRLYPPLWSIGREARRPVRLGGYDLPAGAKVVICPWVLHRNPRWFPEPERFLPSRWRERSRASLPRGCFIPFSAGSRNCIGERFAMMEAILVLARIAQRWEFAPLSPAADPAWRPQITLRPHPNVRLHATRR